MSQPRAKPASVGSGRWDWEVSGAGRLKGARNAGHRTNELDARRPPIEWSRGPRPSVDLEADLATKVGLDPHLRPIGVFEPSPVR